MTRESFVLYTKIKETVSKLSDEQKGKLFQAIIDYETGEEVTIDDPVAEIAFIPIRQDLDYTNNKWDETKRARSEAGKKGGRPKTNESKEKQTKANESKEKQSETKKAVNVNENVNVNVNGNVNVNEKRKRGRFAPPSLEEVTAYCLERNSPVDPKEFFDYFETGNWVDSKGEPVRNWKQKLLTWEAHAKNRASPKKEKFDLDSYLLNIINGEETG